MPRFLHKTRDPVDYRTSLSQSPDPAIDWFEDPDVSAVASVPQKYWRRDGGATGTLLNPCEEMLQAEKDAVDAAEANQQTLDNRTFATDEIDAVEGDGVRTRALIENANQRINFLINRVIQLQNVVAAMMEASGGAQNTRDAGITQAAVTFPQARTADANTHFAATDTRDKPTAVQDFKDDINAGNQDT